MPLVIADAGAVLYLFGMGGALLLGLVSLLFLLIAGDRAILRREGEVKPCLILAAVFAAFAIAAFLVARKIEH